MQGEKKKGGAKREEMAHQSSSFALEMRNKKGQMIASEIERKREANGCKSLERRGANGHNVSPYL